MKKILLFVLASSILFLSFNNGVLVTDYLPESYVRDGSISYQKEIQKAIDMAAGKGVTLIFPPMVYSVDESGLKIGSNMTLSMYGAVFNLKDSCKNDGYVFWGENVVDVHFRGGEIVGHNDIWEDGINVRGIYITGRSSNIRFNDIYIHDLSSNGIGIFGEPEYNARDIWITDVIIENCCNYYGDYLSERPGPEPGSERHDQGLVALYYCRDFHVSGSRFEKSRSDGTHFYKCERGQFLNNKVYSSQMGGYFLEGCVDVVASANIIKNNGSRGTTIERGSKRCNLVNNVVINSGREGLWAPDCIGLVISGNIFDRNGRKPIGSKPNQLWNANITVNEAHDPTNSPTTDYLIQGNIFYTDDDQHAAIYIDSDKSSNIIVKDNILRGNNKKILVKGEKRENINVRDNY